MVFELEDVCFVLGLGFVLLLDDFSVLKLGYAVVLSGFGEWKLPLQFAAFSRRKR